MSNSSFEHKVSRFIQANRLLDKKHACLVALSGGADSVALLLVLRSLGYPLEAVHCNFHLRREESARDEQFCIRLCHDEGIILHVRHFDTLEYARKRHVSIEMAAREQRYACFEELRRERQASDVCVAHHRGDSVETLLLNLLRGTGIHGLTGIAPRNGHIVRPLLCVSRDEVEAYLRLSGHTFVTDSSNLVDDVVRNKIRLRLLPLMRTINPSVEKSLHQTSLRLREVADIYDETVCREAARALVATTPYIILDAACLRREAILYFWLSHYHFTPAQIERIHSRKDLSTGRRFLSSTHELAVDRGRLFIRPITSPAEPVEVVAEGFTSLPDGRTMVVTTEVVDDCFTVSREPFRASLDADTVAFPLTVRPPRTADRFVPYGMKGSKLVSDFLTDVKRSVFEKEDRLVVVGADGHILWVVGERVDARHAITPATRRVLCLVVTPPSRSVPADLPPGVNPSPSLLRSVTR